MKNPKPWLVSTSRGRPLQHSDPSLPPGWHRQLVKSSDNRWRVVVIGPDGRRFWSKSDLKKAFSGQGKEGIKWEEFNFSVFGSKWWKEGVNFWTKCLTQVRVLRSYLTFGNFSVGKFCDMLKLFVNSVCNNFLDKYWMHLLVLCEVREWGAG